MKAILMLLTAALVSLTACQGGCSFDKIKDKAMEYKDKVPTDKIPTKMP